MRNLAILFISVLSNLDVADCIYPASPLGGAVGLESVGCHCTLELIEVDEDKRTYRDKEKNSFVHYVYI